MIVRSTGDAVVKDGKESGGDVHLNIFYSPEI